MSTADIQAAREQLATLLDPPAPVPRSTFDKWTDERKALFCRAGGKIEEDRPATRHARNVITRAAFNALSRAQQAEVITTHTITGR